MSIEKIRKQIEKQESEKQAKLEQKRQDEFLEDV
jgi:hypothetical protein